MWTAPQCTISRHLVTDAVQHSAHTHSAHQSLVEGGVRVKCANFTTYTLAIMYVNYVYKRMLIVICIKCFELARSCFRWRYVEYVLTWRDTRHIYMLQWFIYCSLCDASVCRLLVSDGVNTSIAVTGQRRVTPRSHPGYCRAMCDAVLGLTDDAKYITSCERVMLIRRAVWSSQMMICNCLIVKPLSWKHRVVLVRHREQMRNARNRSQVLTVLPIQGVP